jgi:hypothetical protein
MRLALALIVAFVVAACAIGQSGPQQGFVYGGGARAAQAAIDAEAILQGMAQARGANERLARELHQSTPGAAPPSVTR